MSERRIYEGLFLFPQAAAGDLQGALDHLDELFKRAEAEVVSLCKWDERRLAYEIKGNKRGVYFLAYLKLEPAKLTVLERNCNLSERLLRSMVTRADHVPAETVAAADGRAKLADEIKLRGTDRKAAGDTRSSSVTTAKEKETAAKEKGAAKEKETAKEKEAGAKEKPAGATASAGAKSD